MTREVEDDADSVIWRVPKLKVISHTSYNQPFLKLYEDVEVVIREFETHHSIFVVKRRNHYLVLGETFLNMVKFGQDCQPDGVFNIIIHSQTSKSIVFQIISLNNLSNRTESEISPSWN